MFRRARTAGVDQKAIMLGAFAIGLLDLGVVNAGCGDGGLEIVELNALGRAAEVLERMAMECQPGSDTLIPNKLDVLVAAPAERHNKSPGFAQPTTFWIEQAPSVAEVD